MHRGRAGQAQPRLPAGRGEQSRVPWTADDEPALRQVRQRGASTLLTGRAREACAAPAAPSARVSAGVRSLTAPAHRSPQPQARWLPLGAQELAACIWTLAPERQAGQGRREWRVRRCRLTSAFDHPLRSLIRGDRRAHARGRDVALPAGSVRQAGANGPDAPVSDTARHPRLPAANGERPGREAAVVLLAV